MDFGASDSGFEARLCHLIFIYLESNAVILHTFWRPQPWAPIFHKQGDEDNGFTFFNAMSLCFANTNGGTLRRAGWVAFTKTYSRGKWLISHLPPTFAIIIHIPRALPPGFDVPASPSHTFPRPILDVLKSLVSCPQVPSPHTLVPMSPSARPRPTFIHSP